MDSKNDLKNGTVQTMLVLVRISLDSVMDFPSMIIDGFSHLMTVKHIAWIIIIVRFTGPSKLRFAVKNVIKLAMGESVRGECWTPITTKSTTTTTTTRIPSTTEKPTTRTSTRTSSTTTTTTTKNPVTAICPPKIDQMIHQFTRPK